MTQPSHEALTRPVASILRRRRLWIAFVAVLAVLAAMAGGSALADRGGLVNTARTVDTGPQGALGVDDAVTSSQGSRAQPNQAQGNQGQGNSSSQGNGLGNQGNGQGNQGNGQGNQGNGQGNEADPEIPTRPAPDAPADGTIELPPVVTPPSREKPVEPELTLPGVVTPNPSELPVDVTPADKPVEEQAKPVEEQAKPVEEPAKPVEEQAKPVEEPAKPVEVPVVVVPKPAAVPVVAIGIAPGCVADQAVLVQEAENRDTKGASVHFLANADFPASGTKSLTTAPDTQGRDTVTVTAASAKPYVGAGSIAVRTYRAAQTLGGVAYPAVSETRTLTYDAFTCEKPGVHTNVKAQLVNGRIVLAMYARNTGNTTLQVKFNPTAHFPGSASFTLAPGTAKYFTVPTASAAVPATSVSVNVVSSVQGMRVALNRIAEHDALAVAVPN